MRVLVYPSAAFGNISLPSSKSEGHRAIISACLAKGKSVIRNISLSQDIEATISAMKSMGAEIAVDSSTVTVESGIKKSDSEILVDCGESGSTLRFIIPICMCIGQRAVFTGHGRLLERPQSVYEKLCSESNITFVHTSEYIKVDGKLNPGEFSVSGDISSQFISGLMLALPLLSCDSTIKIIPPFESKPYVGLTSVIQKEFGIFSDICENCIYVKSGIYENANININKDASQLGFFAVLAAINGNVECTDIFKSNKQGDMVIADILKSFGAYVSYKKNGICIKKGPLKAKKTDITDCPDLGPVLMVLLSYAGGGTITGTARLKIKESDRGEAMRQELSKLNVTVINGNNSITVNPRQKLTKTTVVSSHNDHRIAMSLCVFAACAEKPVFIDGIECINKSYPNFLDDLNRIGVKTKLYE